MFSLKRLPDFLSASVLFVALITLPRQAIPQETRYSIYLFQIEHSDNVPEGFPVKVEEYFKTILGINSKIKLAGEPTPIQEKEAKPDKTVKRFPSLEKAQSLLWEGKELIDRKKISRALPLLEESRELFYKNLHDLEDFDQFIDASLNLALAYFLEGYYDNAEEELKLLIPMRPALTLDDTYPKEFRKTIDKIREKERTKKTGDITIEVSPSNGRVFVNGILVGEGRQVLKSPVAGRHFLRVILDGYKTKSKHFKTTAPDKPQVLKVDLEPTEETIAAVESGLPPKKEGLAGALQRGVFDKAFFTDAKELSRRVNAEFIIFGFIEKTDFAYHYGIFIYRTSDAKLIFLEPSVMDLDLANMQVALLDAENKLMNALANFPEDKVVKGTPPIYQLVKKPSEKKKDIAEKPAELPAEVKKEPTAEELVVKKDEPLMLPVEEEEAAKREELAGVTTGIEELPPDFPLLFEEAERDYWYKKWWIWTIVGAVVVGGGVGLYYLTAAPSGEGSFSADIKWD